MKIILEPTSKIVEIDGVKTRIWQGMTESDVPCHAHIALIGVSRDADASEFDRELSKVATPRPDLTALPERITVANDDGWSAQARAMLLDLQKQTAEFGTATVETLGSIIQQQMDELADLRKQTDDQRKEIQDLETFITLKLPATPDVHHS